MTSCCGLINTLLTVVPNAYLEHAHHWLILHGRYVCKAHNPQCQACLIADLFHHATVINVYEIN